jgi:hypothetical protein
MMCTISYTCATYTPKSQLFSTSKLSVTLCFETPLRVISTFEKLNIGLTRFVISFDYYSAWYFIKVVDWLKYSKSKLEYINL